MSGLHAEHTA